ncbi:hypothetical protein BVRB_035910, partial [Beta vulgaris subsp. vulgaris]
VFEPEIMIVKQGVHPGHPYVMYVIVSGHVKIMINDDNGNIVQLKILEPGQWFSGVVVPEGVCMPISAKTASEVIL